MTPVARPRPSGLSELYVHDYESLVRLARVLVDSSESAEDCVQDAFVRVHRRWNRIEDPRAYLRTAVINACRDHLRRLRVRRAFRPDPEKPETIPEIEDELDGVLGRLSERRRTAIVLRYYADLSYEEIATHLRCREATVRSLIHRGLHGMRKELQP